jgi:hypothetical protein
MQTIQWVCPLGWDDRQNGQEFADRRRAPPVGRDREVLLVYLSTLLSWERATGSFERNRYG